MKPVLIFDFNVKSDLTGWKVITDVVMGGISESKFYLNTQGAGNFEGMVSIANNGGFCAVKYVFEPLVIKDAACFSICVKGDGNTYQFRVKANRTDGYSYVFTFQTSTDWQTIEIPIAQLCPIYRGQKLNLPNYDGANLEEITFLIGNKKEETFRLLIDRIEVK